MEYFESSSTADSNQQRVQESNIETQLRYLIQQIEHLKQLVKINQLVSQQRFQRIEDRLKLVEQSRTQIYQSHKNKKLQLKNKIQYKNQQTQTQEKLKLMQPEKELQFKDTQAQIQQLPIQRALLQSQMLQKEFQYKMSKLKQQLKKRKFIEQ